MFVGSHWCWQSYKELADSDKAIECLQKAVALDGKYDYRTQYLKTQNGCYLYLVYRTHLLAHFTFASEEHHDGRIFWSIWCKLELMHKLHCGMFLADMYRHIAYGASCFMASVIISEILSLHNTPIDLLLYQKPFDQSFSGWHFSLPNFGKNPCLQELSGYAVKRPRGWSD